ncbi:GNAT family N-acetyltransferase [Bacillus salacetis]|uniref:GNAT family N-acetyltransferase n=1 Tax=Bacillus salacetis TaxID=2315464 RepID=UPI003B9E2387
METYYLTDKVKQLISNAEEISDGPVEPIDLFLGAALVKKGTLLEMYLMLEDDLHDLLVLNRSREEVSVPHKDFSLTVAKRVERIWDRALEIMKNYNQIYLNEGHVLKAFYQLWSAEEQEFLKGLPHGRIRESVTTARDLLVSMNTYSNKEIPNPGVTIKRAAAGDEQRLVDFAAEHFGEGWTKTLKNGFHQEEIPIFLAWKSEKLIGFSSYDIYLNQKGIYGPMGVIKEERKNRLGSILLHEALSDMKRKGYAYIVLGEAGPIEYYEKECGAMLIPFSSPQAD